jgi:cytosine/adenosine deaminase-related metal-dependent hydrolase
VTAAPERAELLIRDAELLVTMTGDELSGGWVAISGGMVDAVGPAGREPEAAETLSARGCLVTPGLVNAHHHMFQNLTRAFGPVLNSELMNWAGTQSDMWVRLDEEAAYVSTWIGLAELALGGCTLTTDDLYAHPRPKLIDAQIAAARELGFRFDPCRGAVALGRDDGLIFPRELVQDRDTILADTERLIDTYHDRSPGAMTRIVVGPSGSSVATPGLMEAAAELAERHDVRMTTHLSQFNGEEEWSLGYFGLRQVDWLESVGWGSDRAWVAHCIFVTDEEIARLARWGTGVAHCPTTCCLVADGVTPVGEMRRAGVNVGLAVDGGGSEHASMWLEAHTALLLGRLRLGPMSTSARDVLELATLGSARCLGREGTNGVLAPGACGDVAVWPLDGVRFAGAHTDPVEAWLRCGPVSARHTVIAGKPVVRDGELTASGLDEMLRRHERISREWQGALL